MTGAELIALPAAINLVTLGRALGVSEPVVRELNRQKKLEQEMGIRVRKLGPQYRVITADVLRYLGIDPERALSNGAHAPAAQRADA